MTVVPYTTCSREADLALMLNLASRVDPYGSRPLALIMSQIGTAATLGQYRLWVDTRGRVVGFTTWAFLSEEAITRIKAPGGRFEPQDFRSGGQPWLVDLVAPFGHFRAIAADLRRLFGPVRVHWMRSKRGWKEGWGHGLAHSR